MGPECKHLRVQRFSGEVATWKCLDCDEQFFPMSAVYRMAQISARLTAVELKQSQRDEKEAK